MKKNKNKAGKEYKGILTFVCLNYNLNPSFTQGIILPEVINTKNQKA